MFQPTPEQIAVVEFVRDNPNLSLMVDARAGAAKTSTIILATEAIFQPCLAIAFNKRIAVELEERIPNKAVVCKTLNALGHAAWGARLGKRLQVDTDKMYNIAKATEGLSMREDDIFMDVLNLARKAKANGVVPQGAPRSAPGCYPDSLESWEEMGFNLGIDVTEEIVIFARRILLKSIEQAFQGTIDFDDQIYMSVLFGGQYTKFHTVIVDESQDLSPMNHRQLAKVVGTRLIAIGDPYQAIYAFRGADNNSMTNMADAVGLQFTKLKLTYSFRAPFTVSERQRDWVPDFQSFESCKPGTVEHWPRHNRDKDGNAKPWSLDDIPHEGAILCRNNAPLMELAFALIKVRRPVKILGRDIGASLATALLKIAGKGKNAKAIPVEDMIVHVKNWAQKEIAKCAGAQSKISTVLDKEECLLVLLEASGAATVGEAADFIKNLFSDKGESLVLSSGHRSKGLEWDWVMHLDPWRCPSKFAIKAADRGDPSALIQENNLRYVIETRTKDVLVLANLDDCEDMGK